MSQFWDQRFAEPGFKYGRQPNAFLAAEAAGLAPGGRILLPGDGEGRNSVWLAQQGHRVLAVDSSAVGLAKARDWAAQAGVADRWAGEQADLADWTPPGGFDAAVLVFLHLPSALRRAVHRQVAQALRPGGVLLLEAFRPEQLARASGGPKDADLLCTLADLRADFDGLLDETRGEAVEIELDEGPGHQGPACTVRYRGVRR